MFDFNIHRNCLWKAFIKEIKLQIPELCLLSSDRQPINPRSMLEVARFLTNGKSGVKMRKPAVVVCVLVHVHARGWLMHLLLGTHTKDAS